MKKTCFWSLLIMGINLLFCDVSGNTGLFDLGDRVRNCPAMTTQREGTSNTIFVATFGLQPDYSDSLSLFGKPGTLWKINYENFLTGLTADYNELYFDDSNYDYLKAYSHDDSVYISANFNEPEDSYRLMGQKGFWASPVLDEEYGVIYLITKAGMLFAVNTETMEVDNTAGHYHNLRALEETAGSGLNINNYEYLATPLLCRDGGEYLIILYRESGMYFTFPCQAEH